MLQFLPNCIVLKLLNRNLVATVYKKGGTTQNKSFDMTYEELQRELGLGVDCN